eukprot:11105079-Heterocapsa_arctica.AAC.1
MGASAVVEAVDQELHGRELLLRGGEEGLEVQARIVLWVRGRDGRPRLFAHVSHDDVDLLEGQRREPRPVVGAVVNLLDHFVDDG